MNGWTLLSLAALAVLGQAPTPSQKAHIFDKGGFGGAPKFPRPVVFNYLLRYFAVEKNKDALDMVTKTLRAMAAGGMHDQLGGGFHRYSVDERWFVPHFEKMLYDQAQLAVSYVEAYQITKEPIFAETARDIFTYLLRDMTAESGGFYSAEDADSADPAEDFVTLARRFAPYADYLTLDVSCPNTANGQVFLDPARLADLLARLAAIGDERPRRGRR